MFSSSSSDGAGSSQNMTKHWLLLRWIVERQLYEPWLCISFCIECRVLHVFAFCWDKDFDPKCKQTHLEISEVIQCLFLLTVILMGKPLSDKSWPLTWIHQKSTTSIQSFWPHVLMALRKENAFNPMKDPSAPPSLRHWLERIGALVETLLEWSQTMEGLFWGGKKALWGGGFVGIDNTDAKEARLRVQSALTRVLLAPLSEWWYFTSFMHGHNWNQTSL